MLTPNLNNSSCEPRQNGPSSANRQALWLHASVQEWYSNVELRDSIKKKNLLKIGQKERHWQTPWEIWDVHIYRTNLLNAEKKTFKMKLHEASLRLSQLSKVNLLSLKACASQCQDVRHVGEAEFTACQSAARMLQRNPCTPCRRSTRFLVSKVRCRS